MRLVYNITIYLLRFGLWIASFFNPKAKKWINGRKGQFERLAIDIIPGDRIIWFHCASLGEFEQGRPIVEAFRKNFSNHKLLLTFFSPSGYEITKNTTLVDFVYYLPLDSPRNTRKFISMVNPRVAIFIKYEYWFNFINQLEKNKIPTFIISAIFQPSQYIFKPWGKWPLHQLQKITHFFVQDENSLKLLNQVKVYHADISGDTRFDRVLALASEEKEFPEVQTFNNGPEPLIVAGSTWPADEDILLKLIEQPSSSFKLIIAPHEIKKNRIDQLLQKFNSYSPQKYSQIDKSTIANSRVLIIDSIGMLSYLYRHAKITYVGGGFGVGIHNLLEAATYGLPIIFGPNYQKFREAIELINLEAGYSISNAMECIETVKLLNTDKIVYKKSGKAAFDYVRNNSGATQKIIEKVKDYLIVD